MLVWVSDWHNWSKGACSYSGLVKHDDVHASLVVMAGVDLTALHGELYVLLAGQQLDGQRRGVGHRLLSLPLSPNVKTKVPVILGLCRCVHVRAMKILHIPGLPCPKVQQHRIESECLCQHILVTLLVEGNTGHVIH